jgi:hypothetical protein
MLHTRFFFMLLLSEGQAGEAGAFKRKQCFSGRQQHWKEHTFLLPLVERVRVNSLQRE